ncbi:nucleotide sugar dehydrogenase [Agaribacter marinus]|uniref:Nucleotide sugar dehydrogenase n=1 Tax=Virgibacillus salarius TaxID=447199 RepID=A0A941DXK9_9BACI|nr:MULTISPECIES: nucleotide sugar dehydrogenase [Bacillaceae]MBR7797172.1 nucleotide sugar dehydrogenase [Virgibacillus salarius]NAZ09881.1 nucleotide sugar dehydrogenase [Agaribacter marinus]
MITNQQEALANVAVIGLGKIGLTIAAVFANNNYNVYGSDINKDVVATINQGKSHIVNEPGLDKLVLTAHKSKNLSATTVTAEAVTKSDIVVVIVPVLIDNQYNVDYQLIDAAVKDIASGIKKGTLVIFETTIPPGDTQHRFGKKIEELSGLRLGEDFYLAYSPERVYSNRIIEDLKKYPKVVGGVNEKSLELAVKFYKNALHCELIEVSSIETAEFSKIAECVYRDVNIALANELAQFAETKGVNMSEVIVASNSQPYSHLHTPGIGVGGHCIPIYPYFFINKGLKQGMTRLARTINDRMANYAIAKIEKELGSLTDKNILILGLSYRENVKEPTKSTTLLLMDQLTNMRSNVFVNDPLFTNEEIKSYGASPLSLQDKFVSEIDVVILQAFHDAYTDLSFEEFKNCMLVLDGRNKLNKNEISSLGITYRSIGNEKPKEEL